jgi:hypothetical protein
MSDDDRVPVNLRAELRRLDEQRRELRRREGCRQEWARSRGMDPGDERLTDGRIIFLPEGVPCPEGWVEIGDTGAERVYAQPAPEPKKKTEPKKATTQPTVTIRRRG